MNGLAPAHRWLAALAGVIAGGVGPAAAQEQPVDIRTSDTQVARDGLADAKRELDAIRALRDPAQPPRPDSPRVGAPEWHGPSGGAPAPALRPARPVAPETKSANWLVDAMQASAKDRERHSGDRSLPSPKSPRRDRALESAERDPRRPTVEGLTEGTARRDAERTANERERDRAVDVDPAAVINPLTRYLEDWMSPQDLALLAPGAMAPGKAGVDSLAGLRPGDATGGVAPPAGVGFDAAFGLRPPAAASIAPPPRENPFLQSLAPPAAGPPSGLAAPKPISPPPAISAPAAALNPAPAANPPPRTPDFARPADDEKYFKPLKRF